MLTTNISQALWEFPNKDVAWPATTTPWLTATVAACRGTTHEFLETFTAHTATEFAEHLHTSAAEPMHMLCAIPHPDCWDIRELVSVHIGKVADTAVVVVRDREGGEFCPDSPNLPVSSVSDVVQIACLAERTRPRLSAPGASVAFNLYAVVAKAAAEESSTEASSDTKAST